MPNFEIGVVDRLKNNQRAIERLETQIKVGRWADWTPTVTQSVSVSVSIGYARYCIIDALVVGQVRLTTTSAGTTNNMIGIGGIPSIITPVASPAGVIGSFVLVDLGTANYVGALLATPTPDIIMFIHGSTVPVGQSPNFALANGDVIEFKI